MPYKDVGLRYLVGLCSQCSATIVPGRKLCEKHVISERIRVARRAIRRASLNHCPDCGREILDNYVRCPSCRKRSRARVNRLYSNRREAGLCEQCGIDFKTLMDDNSNAARCQNCRDNTKRRFYGNN